MDNKLDIFGWMADNYGCGNIRVRMPLEAVRDRGHTVGFGGLLTRDWDQMPKTLVGQRLCKDGPAGLWSTIAEQPERPKLVFELDDDLWNIDPSSPIAYEWFMHGYDRETRTYHKVKENLAKAISAADAVTCTTEPLAELMKQWNSNIHVIPNYLPKWLLDWERPRRDTLTVGWMGSGTHAMDWDYCRPYIKKFLDRNPKVDFRIFGTQRGSEIGFPNDRVLCVGWIDTVEGCWKAIDFDIGIIPLKPHTFNDSKSHLKFTEYAMLGIPTVASNYGPYARVIEHGKTGFLVKQDHEWAKYLRDLVNDEAMRTEIGNNAKEWARTQTLEGNVDKWEAVLLD